MPSRVIEHIAGERFGMLTVTGRGGRHPQSGDATWECICDCGARTTARGTDLRKGTKASCGCNHYGHRLKHGDARGSGTAEYRAWCAMKRRCYEVGNPKYPAYGGRGIRVCDEWRADYELFLAYIGKRPGSRHSLDRIDVNGHYEPGNVRWATDDQQANNRRSNRCDTIGLETRTVSEWSEISGTKFGTILMRLNRGWVARDAVWSAPLETWDRRKGQRNAATALEFGVDMGPIEDEVHRANLAKAGGPVVNGKIMKPPGWTPPDIAGELKKQGWSGE